MSSKTSLYSAVSVLVGLVVIVAGAAKLYRGVGEIIGSGLDPKIAKLLEASDSSVAEANRKLTEVSPAFQAILEDFDKMGITSFRSEKSETCAKLIAILSSVTEDLQQAVNSLSEAIKNGSDKKLIPYLLASSETLEMKLKANKQNAYIIQALVDESMVDPKAIVDKVTSIAEIRDNAQKASDESAAQASAILERSKTEM